MDEIEKQETAQFLRRIHCEEAHRMEDITSRVKTKPIQRAIMRIEYTDGYADEYVTDCRDNPQHIIGFIQRVYVDRSTTIHNLLKDYE